MTVIIVVIIKIRFRLNESCRQTSLLVHSVGFIYLLKIEFLSSSLIATEAKKNLKKELCIDQGAVIS